MNNSTRQEFREDGTSLAQANAGWVYYRQYFAPVADVWDSNESLKKVRGYIIPRPQSATHFSELETTYPGLLVGSGYGHDFKRENDPKATDAAFKVGFFFDHRTGMPVIPGSSVKGLLRSLFPQRVLKESTKKSLPAEFCDSRENFMRETIQQELKITATIDIDRLEKEIFDGLKGDTRIPVYHRDIFYDAVPVVITGPNIMSQNGTNKYEEYRIFADDDITPHKHRAKEGQRKPELDPFSNPVPIKFLKVLPRVVYEFRFRLGDSQTATSFRADKKKELFEYILTTFGIGAKTRVGYGQFKKP